MRQNRQKSRKPYFGVPLRSLRLTARDPRPDRWLLHRTRAAATCSQIAVHSLLPLFFLFLEGNEIMFRILHQAVGEEALESGFLQAFSLDGEHIVPGFPAGGKGSGSQPGHTDNRLVYGLLIPFYSINSTESFFRHIVFQCSTDPYFCFWLSQPDKGKVRRTPADHGNPIQGIAGIPAEGIL